jgi:membrane-associated phospholipid phosphatase
MAFSSIDISGIILILHYLVSTGSLTALTLGQEQWLLQRPLTRFDCVVRQWKSVGEAQISVIIVLALCIVCWLLMALALALAFGGGIGQFYIGGHLFTDTMGGYLLGTCFGCCAIAFLHCNETRSRRQLPW